MSVATEAGGIATAAAPDPVATWRLAFEAMPVGVLVSTTEGDWANAELLRMWRRPEGSVDRRTFGRHLERLDLRRQRHADRDRRRPPSPLALAWRGRPAEAARYRLLRGDGTNAVARISATPLRGVDGKIQGAVVIAVDETVGYDAERLRDAFLGILGHELRTPITSIVGGAELLQANGLPTAVRGEVAASLVAEAHRLNRLVEQLLDLAQLERRGGLTAEPVQLAHLVRRVVQLEQVRRPRLAIHVDAPRSVPASAGDEGYVMQVLAILIDNAARYGARSGDLWVRVAAEARGVEVHVLDDGPGLPRRNGNAIFGLFERGPARGEDDRSGTGIGLFVARAIVEALGGWIWAENRPDGGADVGFALPPAQE